MKPEDAQGDRPALEIFSPAVESPSAEVRAVCLERACRGDERLKARVALKVIKLGTDTRSVIARFEAERQALALMDRPNIAKVFDAGAAGAEGSESQI